MLVFDGFWCATRALRVRVARIDALWVLEMICGMRGVFGCDFGLFARIFRTELRRFRSKIARFSVRFGAILARKTRASTTKHVRPLLAFAGHAQEKICSKILNVRCVAREKTCKTFDENRTILCWFLQVFSTRHVRCGCASLRKVLHGCWR